jgi:hypothetical protein
MKQERIHELEDQALAKKLFKNAVFKGGSSGGGTNTVQKADPWEQQKPFLEYGFQQAQDRYKSDQPSFYPHATISPFNVNELAYQQGTLDYATGGRPQALQAGAENVVGNELLANPSTNAIFNATRGLAPYGQESLVAASNFTDAPILDEANASPIMQQMLSGSVQNNPFIQQANNAFAADAVANFQQQVMPALRASQIAYQPGGSSRGDIASGIAAGNVGRSITDFTNRNYMDAFNAAQAQQMGAAQLMEQARARRAGEALQQGQTAFQTGLAGEQGIRGGFATGLDAYPTVSQTPIDMLGNVSDIGVAQREMTQQQLDEAINRYQYEQNIQDQKLGSYMDLIQGNFGGNTVTSASRGGTGLAGSLGKAGGSIAALAGLLGGD